MRSRKMLMVAMAAVVPLAIVGCGSDEEEQDDTGLANPASVFCVEQGGESVIDGSAGVCVLPDGTEVDEWEYYRENHSTVGLANPASVFCVEQGGESVIDGSAGVCVLPDGTEVDEWEYYRENHSD